MVDLQSVMREENKVGKISFFSNLPVETDRLLEDFLLTPSQPLWVPTNFVLKQILLLNGKSTNIHQLRTANLCQMVRLSYCNFGLA